MENSETLEAYSIRVKMACYECNQREENVICEYFKEGLPEFYKNKVSPE